MNGEIVHPPASAAQKSYGCGLWIFWVVSNSIGMGLGWSAGWWISFYAPGDLATFFLGATIGLFVGGMQWLVMQGLIQRPGLWLLATVLGWGVGFQLGVRVAYMGGLADLGFGAAVGISSGSVVGLFQWFVSRRQLSSAGLWVLTSTLGWAAGLIFYRPGISAIGFVYGALYGPITGWALIKALQDTLTSDASA